MLAGLREGTVWADISTIAPDASVTLAERVREGRGTLVENHDSVTALALTIHGVGTFAARQGAPALGNWNTSYSIGAPPPFRRLAWNGQEPDATTPAFMKSCICTFASCQ